MYHLTLMLAKALGFKSNYRVVLGSACLEYSKVFVSTNGDLIQRTKRIGPSIADQISR